MTIESFFVLAVLSFPMSHDEVYSGRGLDEPEPKRVYVPGDSITIKGECTVPASKEEQEAVKKLIEEEEAREPEDQVQCPSGYSPHPLTPNGTDSETVDGNCVITLMKKCDRNASDHGWE